MGNYKEGILIYDMGGTGKIISCQFPNHVEINQIAALNAHELLVATGGKGVYKLDVNTYMSEPYITADYSSYNGMNGNNINDVYDRIRDDNTTRTKEIAVKNIDSDEYPTTDTYVRVRLVPMIVYDDSKENIKAGIAGNIAAVDMRGKVSYSYANELKSKADVDKAMKDNEDLTGSWFYMDNSSSDDNERYYYYSAVSYTHLTLPTT